MSNSGDFHGEDRNGANDPFGWARFRLQEPIEATKEQEQAKVQAEEPEKEHKRKPHVKGRRMRLAAAFVAMAMVGGIFGGGAMYFVMRGNEQALVSQAVNRAVNALSLNPAAATSTTAYQSGDFSDVIEQVSEGVVAITAQSQGMSYYGNGATSAGSGVIIRSDGIIVTCAHVIEGSNAIKVYLKNGQEYDAQVIGSDEKSDIAVLKINATNLTPVALGDSSKVRLGDNVIAIGNPLGELNGSVTVGVISAVDRSITIDNYTMTVLQTDAAINPGNSGGALLNGQGQLIGIVNAKSSGTSVEGLGFAIPLNRITTIIEQILTYGYVKDRPYLGISMQQISNSRMGNTPGVYIVQVYNDTAAAKAGLAIGDRIVSIDGKAIQSVSDIDSMIDTFHVGQTITIVLDRDGKQVTVQATLTDSSKK